MKKILLATTLLSIAMSENILMENHLRPKTIWIRDKQFWNRKIKRVLHGDASSEIEDLVNYDDDKQLPRISDTRFISETIPAVVVVRWPNVSPYSQVDLLSSDKPKLDLSSSDKPKVESAKPTILISIDIQEKKKTSEEQDNCTEKKNYHRKNNQDRQIQKPFYVEEPRWIDIDPEYTDSSRYIKDPYILTRGKKIFRMKDLEQGDKIIEDYEFIDYPSKSKTSLKNRVRRSVEINKKYQDSTVKESNEEKRANHNFLQDNRDTNIDMIKTENRNKKFSRTDNKFDDKKTNKEKDVNVPHNVSIKKYKKDKPKNLAKKSPRKLTKRNQIFADGAIITNFFDQEQMIQHEDDPNNIANNNTANEGKRFNGKSHFASDTNKRNKRSALRDRKFSEGSKTYEMDWVDSKKGAEKNGIDVFEQNKVYIDELDDLSTYDDPFILSREKNSFDSGKNSSNKNDANHRSIEKLWKIKYHAYREKLENEDEARNKVNKLEADARATDSQLTDKFDSKTIGIKSYSNNREKRNTCETCGMDPQFQEELWWKNIERNIQDSLSLERRDKHSDILDRLRLTEPFIISRGKKALHEFKDNFFRMQKLRNENDANRAKIKTLLNMILMEKYNDNYNTNVVQLSNKISRDRRGELDDILIPYDPYYVARGKRANLNNFLTKTRLLRNEKFEMDAK